MTGPADGRFQTLDAMRGLAAVAVAAYHIGRQFPEGQSLAPRGYLAVDFFFLLSGFVVAHAYERRLQQTLSFVDFAVLRLIRLYPLFLLGAAIGALGYLLKMLAGSGQAPPLGLFLLWLPTNGLMLPSINTPNLFPLNGLAWSLMGEIIINLIYAAVLFRLPKAALLAIAAAPAVLLVAGAVQNGSLNLGWTWATVHFGLARGGFSFLLGIVLFRLGAGSKRVRSWAAILPLLVLPALLAIPAGAAPGGPADALIVIFVFPPLFLIAARFDPPAAFDRVCALAGNLSYPLYATHYTLIVFYAVAARQWADQPLLYSLVFIAVSLAAALIALMVYDVPVRRRLSLWVKRPAPAPI